MWLPMSGTAVAGGAEAVWRDLHDQLLGFITRRVRTREDAEDILQEVMLRIHRSSGELDRVERVSGWIYRIAQNAIVDYYRKPARRELPTGSQLDAEERGGSEPASLADEPDTAELRGELARCMTPLIERLPASYRQALMLTELDDVTQAEAAARLGLSVSGMKTRVQRGRERLKDLLLDCCHVELDRRQGVSGYRSRRGPCACGRHTEAASPCPTQPGTGFGDSGYGLGGHPDG
jgi:RNA polymerase sigma-70 factor, ECF subfamily